MSDQYVLQAQKYLNATYKGKNGWIPLEENGNTGTLMIGAGSLNSRRNPDILRAIWPVWAFIFLTGKH